MNIIQLEYFVVVAQEQHYTRAAKKLNLSQPTLSTSISRLEEEVGARLFTRTGRQVVINEDGKLFLEYAKRIIADYKAALADLEQRHKAKNNVLTIAFNTYDSQNYLIRKFSKAHPEIYMHVRMVAVEPQKSFSLPPDANFLISNIPCTDASVSSRVIAHDKLYLIMSRDHPLSKKASLTFDDVLDERFVTNPEGSGFNCFFDDLFREAGFKVPYKAYAMPPDWTQFISESYLALVTENYIRGGHFASNMVFIPFVDMSGNPYYRTLNLIWNSKKPLTPPAKTFLNFSMNES